MNARMAKLIKAAPEDIKIKGILIRFDIEVAGVEAYRTIRGKELRPELHDMLRIYLARHVTGFTH